MPSTYKLISSNILSTTASSVTFSDIPATFTDLVVRLSYRQTTNSHNYTLSVGTGAGLYSETSFHTSNLGSTTAARTSNTSPFGTTSFLFGNASGDTADTFGISEVYIPNYLANDSKPVSLISVRERNSTSRGIGHIAGLYRVSSAISQIVISPSVGFATGSSFYLYGISNS